MRVGLRLGSGGCCGGLGCGERTGLLRSEVQETQEELLPTRAGTKPAELLTAPCCCALPDIAESQCLDAGCGGLSPTAQLTRPPVTGHSEDGVILPELLKLLLCIGGGGLGLGVQDINAFHHLSLKRICSLRPSPARAATQEGKEGKCGFQKHQLIGG